MDPSQSSYFNCPRSTDFFFKQVGDFSQSCAYPEEIKSKGDLELKGKNIDRKLTVLFLASRITLLIIPILLASSFLLGCPGVSPIFISSLFPGLFIATVISTVATIVLNKIFVSTVFEQKTLYNDYIKIVANVGLRKIDRDRLLKKLQLQRTRASTGERHISGLVYSINSNSPQSINRTGTLQPADQPTSSLDTNRPTVPAKRGTSTSDAPKSASDPSASPSPASPALTPPLPPPTSEVTGSSSAPAVTKASDRSSSTRISSASSDIPFDEAVLGLTRLGGWGQNQKRHIPVLEAAQPIIASEERANSLRALSQTEYSGNPKICREMLQHLSEDEIMERVFHFPEATWIEWKMKVSDLFLIAKIDFSKTPKVLIELIFKTSVLELFNNLNQDDFPKVRNCVKYFNEDQLGELAYSCPVLKKYLQSHAHELFDKEEERVNFINKLT